jgi:hypothetical protein
MGLPAGFDCSLRYLPVSPRWDTLMRAKNPARTGAVHLQTRRRTSGTSYADLPSSSCVYLNAFVCPIMVETRVVTGQLCPEHGEPLDGGTHPRPD